MTNYPKPARDSGLGIHLGANAWFVLGENEHNWPAICDDLAAMGMTWAKVITTGNNLLSALRIFEYQGSRNVLAERGIMPIVRFLWNKTYPVTITADLLNNIREATRRFMDKGVVYFECDNEPNLIDEWESWDAWHRFDAPDARPHHAADAWIEKASVIAEVGGIPLLTALAPGGHHDDEDFYPRMVQRLKDRQAHDLLRKSAIAVHNYWLKHGIDYPFDPINQAEHPGAHLHSGRGMSNGFLKYRYVREVFERIMGFGIPVLTTEGGQRLADPTPDFRYWQEITPDVHRENVLQQAAYMATKAPSWYFCTNDWIMASKEWGGDLMWDWAAWISPVRNPARAPIIDALKQRGFVPRHVAPDPAPPPPVDTLPDFIRDVSTTLPRHPTARWPERTRPVTHIVVHHSASPRDATTPEAIARYHVNHHGWAGAGYSLIITGDGTAWLANHLHVQSRHVGSWSDRAIGICFTGLFTPGAETPSAAQLAAGRKVLAWLYGQLGLTAENVLGHRDVPGAATKCPGSDWWRALLATEPTEPPTIRAARWHSEEAVREIERGDPAAARQRLLTHVIAPLYALEAQPPPTTTFLPNINTG